MSILNDSYLLDPAQWSLFLDVAELGSLSKVAQHRGVSQPHISRLIADLEKSYGARLFNRNGRGVTLTELGLRILPIIKKWLDSTAQTANDIQAFSGKIIGTVYLGILPSLANTIAHQLISQVRVEYPYIQLRIREGQGAQLEHWLEDGSLDLALLFRHGTDIKPTIMSLGHTQTYLVGPVGDKLTKRKEVKFTDLEGLPMVSFCRPSSWRETLEQIAREHQFRLNVVLEADSLAVQMAMVEQGLYCLLGGFATHGPASLKKIQLAQIVEPCLPRSVVVELSRSGQMTTATKAILNLIKKIKKLKL